MIDDFEQFRKEYEQRKKDQKVGVTEFNRLRNTDVSHFKDEIMGIFIDSIDKGYTVDINVDSDKTLFGLSVTIKYPIRNGLLKAFNPIDLQDDVYTLFDYLNCKNIRYGNSRIPDSYNTYPEYHTRSMEINFTNTIPSKIKVSLRQ